VTNPHLFGYLGDYLIWWLCLTSLVVHTWCFLRFFPRDKRPRLRLVMGNFLVFLSLLGGVAMIAETNLRFFSIHTDAFGMTLSARRWNALYVDLNSRGCRDRDWVRPKPAGVRRIALVGDSFTFGWGIENVQDRFGDLIQARLDAGTQGQVEVMNVAKPGWATYEQAEFLLTFVPDYEVDEVVLCYVPNDIEKIIPTERGFNPTIPPMPTLMSTDRSALYEYLYRRVLTPYRATVRNYHDWLADGYADREIWKTQQEHLGWIIQTCREHDVTLRAALLPFLRTGGTRYNAKAIHATLRDFFEANGAACIDLLPALQGQPIDSLILHPGDPHPNVAAHRLFAERIRSAFYAEVSP
jgi:lysophospholipase L1-like esterase